jgi:hypothetical protein
VVLYPTKDYPESSFYVTINCLDDFNTMQLVAFADALVGSEADYRFSLIGADDSMLELNMSGTGRADTASIPRHYRVSIGNKDEIAPVLGVFKTADGRENAKYVKLEVKQEKTLTSKFEPAGIDDAVQYLGCLD